MTDYPEDEEGQKKVLAASLAFNKNDDREEDEVSEEVKKWLDLMRSDGEEK